MHLPGSPITMALLFVWMFLRIKPRSTMTTRIRERNGGRDRSTASHPSFHHLHSSAGEHKLLCLSRNHAGPVGINRNWVDGHPKQFLQSYRLLDFQHQDEKRNPECLLQNCWKDIHRYRSEGRDAIPYCQPCWLGIEPIAKH